MSKPFTLAMAQMLVEGGNPAANLSRAVDRIESAASRSADVVLLPEVLDLGWTHPSCHTLAQPIPDGESFRTLSRAARQSRVYVCAGLVERDGERIYNAAVLIDPEGSLLLRHRKLNELDIAHDCYDQGDRLGVCHTDLATFGLMICADAFAEGQVLTRSLGYMGADVILSPTAWAVPPDFDNEKNHYANLWLLHYAPVAHDYSLWIAGVSNVGPIEAGPWTGHLCIGESLLVGPDGREVLRGPFGVDAEALLLQKIEPVPRPARGTGWSQLRKREKPDAS